MSWLLASISEAMLGQIVWCTSTIEVWQSFEKLFATDSKAWILQLQNMLQSTKKGSLSIGDYMLKMCEIVSTLCAIGQQITDDDLLVYILMEDFVLSMMQL